MRITIKQPGEKPEPTIEFELRIEDGYLSLHGNEQYLVNLVRPNGSMCEGIEATLQHALGQLKED